ncbi:MAG: hypothetical protein JWM05_1894, partial [Acidimicrobiales bacterium]|nr:hypothetical protein [Acidimicrobiales bacterium]
MSPGTPSTPAHPLVVGYAVTGRAVARALAARGATVTAVDDRPTKEMRQAAGADG